MNLGSYYSHWSIDYKCIFQPPSLENLIQYICIGNLSPAFQQTPLVVLLGACFGDGESDLRTLLRGTQLSRLRKYVLIPLWAIKGL